MKILRIKTSILKGWGTVNIKLWNLFKNEYKTYLIISTLVFLISIITCYVYSIENHDITFKTSKRIMESMGGEKQTILQSILALIFNNLKVVIMILLDGFIPTFILPLMILIKNGYSIGVILAAIKLNNHSLVSVIFGGILPHGVFELSGFIISASLALYINVLLLKKIKNRNFKIAHKIKNTFIVFLVIVIPLVVVAGIMEGAITPIILSQLK